MKLFFTDLDGTLTDGRYYTFSEHDGISKSYNTRDFHGMMMLSQYDVEFFVITLSSGLTLHNQISRLNQIEDKFKINMVARCYDKKTYVQNILTQRNIDWDQTCFIGDDTNDIELLKVAGVAACPSDAMPEIIDVVRSRDDGFVMTKPGGSGCVREFCDMIRSTMV